MGFFGRLRFLIGLIVVIGLVGALFLHLNYSMSHIQSQRATLELSEYSVVTEYGGVVRQHYVEPGQKVKEGDRLFEISSPSLTQAIRNKQADSHSLLYEVLDNGNMALLASADGVVQQINPAPGAYVSVHDKLATILVNDNRHIVARYLLNAPDYARINRNNRIHVTLPDNTSMEAEVSEISLEQDGEQVFTVVKARLPASANVLPTFSSGTPVSTSWKLDNSDWQESLFRFVRSIIEPRTQ